jgi:hypothetical protein
MSQIVKDKGIKKGVSPGEILFLVFIFKETSRKKLYCYTTLIAAT